MKSPTQKNLHTSITHAIPITNPILYLVVLQTMCVELFLTLDRHTIVQGHLHLLVRLLVRHRHLLEPLSRGAGSSVVRSMHSSCLRSVRCAEGGVRGGIARRSHPGCREQLIALVGRCVWRTTIANKLHQM